MTELRTSRAPIYPEVLDGCLTRAIAEALIGDTDELARPDRRDFNIPDGLQDGTTRSVYIEWLPAYLIQNAGSPPYLAYTMASEGRDGHVEALAAAIAPTLAAERPIDAPGIWRDWLNTEGFPDVAPQALANGVLRATLLARAFGTDARFRLYQLLTATLGSFETRQTSFLQLWCTDERLRRRAVLERAKQRVVLRVARTPEALHAQLHELAGQLDVAPPTSGDLVRYAQRAGDELALAALDDLT